MKHFTDGYPTLEDAIEALIPLLDKENKSRGIPTTSYIKFIHKSKRVADSFEAIGENPVTPFDIPEMEEESDTYEIRGYTEDYKHIGGRGFVYKENYHYPNDHTEYRITLLSVEETDPYNYTLPFRNLSETKLPIFARMGILFSKPTTPISIEEAQTPEGQRKIREYISNSILSGYWDYEIDEEKYINRTLKKEDLFRVEDEEAEENPEEYPETYENNLILLENPSPSFLSRITGKKINSAKSYLSAFEMILGTKLDHRERKAVVSTFNFTNPEILLDYATYEFIRTENYPHLKEILSRYSDFGLPYKWEKESILLYDSFRENPRYKSLKGFEGLVLKGTYRTPEEYVISRYLKNEWSNLLSSISLKDLSRDTGTPISVLSKAVNFKVWE